MNVLIADHDATTRQQLSLFLLEHGHKVYEAEDGQKALEIFKQNHIDGVYGRLDLPAMDGFTLLQTLKTLNAHIPFVAMTHDTSKETILRSFSLGACDLLNQPLLPSNISQSLSRILQLNEDFKFNVYCLENSIFESRTLEIENNFTLINPIVSFMTRNLPSFGILEQSDLFSLNIALVEALNNAIYHGNLEVSSELKQQRFELFREEAERRRHIEPYCHRRVFIHYELSRNSVKYVIRDEGQGFDYSSLPDPTLPENLFKESGRGILMIMSFMDEVFWNSRGNEITMIRYKKHGTNPFRQSMQ